MLLKQCLAFTLFRQYSNFGIFSRFPGLKNIDVKNFGVKVRRPISLYGAATGSIWPVGHGEKPLFPDR
jgi:hypothetical protein